jgi:hypothetical protein
MGERGQVRDNHTRKRIQISLIVMDFIQMFFGNVISYGDNIIKFTK